MREYNLAELGIDKNINIKGTLTILSVEEGASVIFLFDEHHGTPKCTEQNIANAKEIILNIDAQFVGVEGYEGGYEYDYWEEKYLDRYINGEVCDATCIRDNPEIAPKLVEFGVKVVGVDNRGLCDQMEVDVSQGKWEAENIGKHPNQEKRSRHYIETLFLERKRLNYNGSSILNAGRNHIDHIVKMIEENSVSTIAGEKASYIRIRSSAYHDHGY